MLWFTGKTFKPYVVVEDLKQDTLVQGIMQILWFKPLNYISPTEVVVDYGQLNLQFLSTEDRISKCIEKYIIRFHEIL